MRIADEGGARVLAVGERPLTGPQLHLRAVLDVTAEDVLVAASAGAEAAAPETGEVHVWRVNELGVERLTREPGVHSAVRAGDVTVLVSATPDRPGATVRVLRGGGRRETGGPAGRRLEDGGDHPVVRRRSRSVPARDAHRGGRTENSVRRAYATGLPR
ncbi:hypothetical protein GCM10020295_28050 [Streptomyces cinereospinus]